MHYTQLFRSLREAKGLTVEALSERSGHHRNTVLNVESGRPVKFRTIRELMAQMGYAASSPELRSMALLWLEEVSGIPFSRPETENAARKTVATYGSEARQAMKRLDAAVSAEHLTADQIELLVFAARHPAALAILSHVRDLSTELAGEQSGLTELKAAEDEED
jgi:transcriptional regulator with XRE-family HTH domain